MAGQREKPEDIILKLWQVEVLQGRVNSVSEAVRQIDVKVQASGRIVKWRGILHLARSSAPDRRLEMSSQHDQATQ